MSRSESFDNSPSALIGLMLLSFVLGSVHAFSVLLPAMEKELGTSRIAASLTYSLALASLALGVLMGHRLYSRVTPTKYVVAMGSLAAAGCLIAGFGGSVAAAWLGYGIFFGGANGLGYGYALQFAAQIFPDRKGVAIGSVNAAYAFGAISFPFPLTEALGIGGWSAALLVLSLAIIAFTAGSSVLLAHSRVLYLRSADRPPIEGVAWQTMVSLWLAFCFAVTAGLMVMGQATRIADAAGAGETLIIASPAVIAAANMVGCILCGAVHEHVRARPLLITLGFLTSITLIAMALLPMTAVTVIGLAVVGFAYGGVISVFPAAVSRSFGSAAGASIYGWVFTGWAAAGLLGPGLAGWLYDLNRNYTMALIVGAAMAVFSTVFLPRLGRT